MPKIGQKIGPYTLERFLGKGGIGEVYLASNRGRRFALKFFNADLDSAYLPMFRQEVRWLSQLSHPYLVKIFDFFETERSRHPAPFFVMEYLEGQTLDSLPPETEFSRFEKLFLQTCLGLHYLHSKGILHRDLKPGNLFCTLSGDAKILDFSLSIARGTATRHSPSGTYAYMPPEAFEGRHQERSDLFALGVLFYQACSGSLPYPKPMLGRNLSSMPKPIPLKDRQPSIPEYFSDLIANLLESDPKRRPDSALTLLKYLPLHSKRSKAWVQNSFSNLQKENLPLTGREAELAQVENFLGHPQAGPRGILVEGPTGIGRSRFVEELRWKYLLKGWQVASVEPLSTDDWLQELTCGLGAPAQADSENRILAISERLGAGTVDSPSLLLFRDLDQWSLVALRQLEWLLKTLSGKRVPVSLLFENNLEWQASLRNALPQLDEYLSQTLILTLKDLAPDATARLLNSLDLLSQLSAERVREISRASGGRPLLVVELFHNAFLGNDATLNLPENLREVYQGKLRNLSAKAKLLLALVLTSTVPMRPEELAALMPDGAETRQELVGQEWLSPFVQNPQLRHPSLRPLLLTLLREEDRRAAHLAWMEFEKRRLEKSPQEDSHLLSLVEHALALQDQDTLAKHGFAALFALDRRQDFAKALAWSEELLQLSPKQVDHCRIYAFRAPLFYRLARYSEALRAYRHWYELRQDDETQLQKTKFHYYLGLTHFGAAAWEDSARELEACLATGDSRAHAALRQYHAKAESLLASIYIRQGRRQEARNRLERALSIGTEDVLFQGELKLRLGDLCLQALDWSRAEEFFHHGRADFLKSPRPEFAYLAENSLAVFHREKGALAKSLTHADAALTLAAGAGQKAAKARFTGNRALLLLSLGRFGEAQEAIRESKEFLEVFGSAQESGVCAIQAAQIHLFLGNFQLFNEDLEGLRAKQPLLRRENLWGDVLRLRAEAALLTGNFSAALSLYEALLQTDSAASLEALQITLGRLKACHLLRGVDPESLAGLSKWTAKVATIPAYEGWLRLFNFFSKSPQAQSVETLERVVDTVRIWENPLARIEAYFHLEVYFLRHRLKNFGDRFLSLRKTEWESLHRSLPEELKMDHQKNLNLLDAEKVLETPVQAIPRPASAVIPSVPALGSDAAISEHKFRQFCEVCLQISRQSDLHGILERVMDAALLITGAERGFLILKEENGGKGPVPGFEIKSFRNLNPGALAGKDFHFSWSIVKHALIEGSPVHSDNAMAEEKFREMKSVHALQLQSILAAPMDSGGKILGVLYLDNRYQTNRFQGSDIMILSGLANLAGAAIQKQRMLEDLGHMKARLETKVQDQEQRIENLSEELTQSRENLKYDYSGIVGGSQAMMRVFKLLDHVSKTKIPVWIWGDSGTGKELIAASLHQNSPRKNRPFVAENCSAIPENLLESELFGHKKGAFTHADRDRIGLFEQANGGTLFLDEVADMSLPMQAKLLRVLQEDEIRPLGSNKKVKIDVRLVTASNRDLAAMVEKGTFREDLFYRINGMTIALPRLRDRKEDIPALVFHLIKKISKKYQQPECKVTQEALEFLMAQPWPGNVRQLEGVLRNAMMFADGRAITVKILKSGGLLQGARGSLQKASIGAPDPKEEAENAEKAQLLECLRRHNLDKKLVAEELGITPKSVYMRLAKHGIPKKNSLLMKYMNQRG